MPEPEAVGPFLEQSSGQTGVEMVDERAWFQIPDCGEQVDVDNRSEQRSRLQGGRRLRTRGLGLAGDDLADRGRKLARLRRGQLHQEERVPARTGVEVGRPARSHDGLGRGHVDGPERDPPARQLYRPGVVAAAGDDDERGAARAPPGGEVQPLGRGEPGEVDIVDDEHRRLAAPGPQENIENGLEHDGPVLLWVDEVGLGRLGRWLPAEHGGERGGIGPEDLGGVLGFEPSEVGVDGVGDRLEREASPHRVAAAGEDGGAALSDPVRPRLDQGRLPDARLALDHRHHDAGRAGPGQLAVEDDQLGLASGQGLGAVSGSRRRSGRTGQLVAENGRVERLGLRRRAHAEIFGQPGPGLGVRGQGRCRPPGGGVGPHEQAEGGLVEGVMVEGGAGLIRRAQRVAAVEGDLGGGEPGPGDQAGHRGAVGGGPPWVGLVGEEVAP